MIAKPLRAEESAMIDARKQLRDVCVREARRASECSVPAETP
jgi:hypothetical protein